MKKVRLEKVETFFRLVLPVAGTDGNDHFVCISVDLRPQVEKVFGAVSIFDEADRVNPKLTETERVVAGLTSVTKLDHCFQVDDNVGFIVGYNAIGQSIEESASLNETAREDGFGDSKVTTSQKIGSHMVGTFNGSQTEGPVTHFFGVAKLIVDKGVTPHEEFDRLKGIGVVSELIGVVLAVHSKTPFNLKKRESPRWGLPQFYSHIFSTPHSDILSNVLDILSSGWLKNSQ